MTPGEKALAEAARLEAARVYGAVQREPERPTLDARVDRLLSDLRRQGPPVVQLAERRAMPAAPVRAIIEQAIARAGGNLDHAAHDVGCDIETVEVVRAAMPA